MITNEQRDEIRYLKDDVECLALGLVLGDRDLIKSTINLMRIRLDEFAMEVA